MGISIVGSLFKFISNTLVTLEYGNVLRQNVKLSLDKFNGITAEIIQNQSYY